MENLKKQIKANPFATICIVVAIINLWNPIIALIATIIAYLTFDKAE